MSRFVSADVARRAHIYSLYMFVLILSVICLGMWNGWKSAPKDITISIPPDLRSGAVVKPGEFHSANVFAFAMLTLRELNRWEEDGAVDYMERILELQHRLTPSYREFLIRDANIKHEKGELKDRSRFALEIAGKSLYRPEFVRKIADGVWEVDISVEIIERVASMENKRIQITYPLRVVRMSVSGDKNMWGIALDGYASERRPERLEVAENSL